MSTTGREDAVLKALLTPVAAPAGLGDRIFRALQAAREKDLVRLATRLDIAATPEGIARVQLGRGRVEATNSRAEALVERTREELAQYLAGTRSYFTVPVDLSELGEFQRAVLSAAREIPFGEIRPYRWVAERIGRPRAVRAVGTALGDNPVPLLIPCHRVVRSDGSLGGYIFGLSVKDRLLALERETPALAGCTTTRIVCRRGCAHEQQITEARRVVFASVREAAALGYRPCRVCRPAA